MSKITEKQSGIIMPFDYKGTKSVKVLYWIFFAILILNVIICVLPIVFAFLSGFKEIDEFYASDVKFLPKSIDLSKIFEAMKGINFGRSVINTLTIFALDWLGNIIVGGIAAYTLSRLKPKGSKLLFKLMLWTMMMPGTLSMVPMFMMWADVPFLHWNFLNTYVPLTFGSMCNIFHILLFKTYFDSIPDSYIEAAKLDGCSNINIFLKIVFPLSLPIIATLSIFVFNGVWNEFFSAFLYLKDPKLATIGLKLYQTTLSSSEPRQLLVSFIFTIPTLLVFCLFSKQIMSNGMSAGIKE